MMMSTAPDSSVRPPHRPTRRRLAALSILSMVLAFGCGNDESSNGGGGTGGNGSAPEPIFAVWGGVVTADGALDAWLSLSPEIGPDVAIDLETSFAPGPGNFLVPGDGTVVWQKGDASEIERYFVQPDNSLVRGETLSFANFGLSRGVDGLIIYLTDTKAYLVDRLNSQIIVWNPESFEIVSSFPLDGFEREGLTVQLGTPVLVDDRIIITARYFRVVDESAEPFIVAAFVDPETDTVTYDEDRRCGNAGFRATASNGDFYFGILVTQAARTFAGEGGDPAVTPCQLRVAAGAREIDDDYFLDLTEMASSELVAGPAQGLGDTFYYAIYDPSVVPILDGVTGDELFNVDAWRIHAATVGDEQGTLTPVPNLAPAGGFFRVDVLRPKEGDPVPFLVQVAADLSESRLTDLSDPTSPQHLLTIPGLYFGIGQVR